MSKITILHTSSDAIENKASLLVPSDQKTISFNELKYWVKSAKILTHLFRYEEAVLIVHDLQLIVKPFILGVVMGLLSRKGSFWEDRQGIRQKIDFRLLFSLFSKFLKDLFSRKKFLKEIERNAEILSEKETDKRILDISKPPVYLRTDLYFGLQSGGSVGHIAGVLNNLSHYTGKPIFLTSDNIPTVKPEWESHCIKPGDAFRDFSEMPPFHYNEVFLDKAIQLIGPRQPSFIYQRYSLNNFSGIKLAKHYQIPFVLEFNGSEIWVNRNWGTALKYEALAERIEYANLKAADLIVVVSRPLKDELALKGISSEKILVNPNGVDPDKYSPSSDGSEVRKRYRLENKLVLGFIGTFGRWHGAEILAEAYGKLLQKFPEFTKEVHLFMIGDGITMPLVKQTLSKWNVSEFCTLTGTVPQNAGPSYLAACDIFVSPHVPNADGSPFFGSPTKLFEYMAMGKGIVASNLDQIGEILEHNHSAWMVKPGDAENLMQGIKTLVDDPSIRNRLGHEARKAAVSRHSWLEHTRRIIDRLCALTR